MKRKRRHRRGPTTTDVTPPVNIGWTGSDSSSDSCDSSSPPSSNS